MIIDGNFLADGTCIKCDVMIVGAGMAGLCIANSLSKYGIDTCIIESGGEVLDHFSTSLSEGEGYLSDDNGVKICMKNYMYESRQRSLGGTGNVWGGKCGVFESKDFEERSWLSNSEWPIKYVDFKKYYDLACYELNLPSFFGDSLQVLLKGRSPMATSNLHDFGTSYRLFSSMMGADPGNAFHSYKYKIANHKSVRIFLNTTVTKINYSHNRDSVVGLTVSCGNGRTHLIQASKYVLAAGGLENPRLLLNSMPVDEQEKPDCNGYIGRYLSGHTVFKNVSSDRDQLHLTFEEQPTDVELYTCKDAAKIQGIFTLTKKAQWRERMANFSVTLEECVNRDGRKISPLFFMVEQIPNPESRVVLSQEKDFYGMRKLRMDWKFSQNDIKNLEKGINLFSKFIKKSAIGNLSSSVLCTNLLETAELSRHHIGTTRMSKDLNSGVVDHNCKVHDIDNLYIAGASVFPTNALANPTLSILALAIRLSEQLKAAI